MHFSVAAPVDPLPAKAVWRDRGGDGGHALFLHIGDDLTILLSPPELGELVGVLLHAIDETPVPAQDDATSAHSR